MSYPHPVYHTLLTSPHSGSVGLSSSLVGDGIASLVDTRSIIPRMKPWFPKREVKERKEERKKRLPSRIYTVMR